MGEEGSLVTRVTERFEAAVLAPTFSSRRELLRELIARRGPGIHSEYEAELRGMTDAELEQEAERTKDARPWVGERAPTDSEMVRVLPPMSAEDGIAG